MTAIKLLTEGTNGTKKLYLKMLIFIKNMGVYR